MCNCEGQYRFSKKYKVVQVNKCTVFVEIIQKVYWSNKLCLCVSDGGGSGSVQSSVHTCKCTHTT